MKNPLLLVLLAACAAWGRDASPIRAVRAERDVPAVADPRAAFWRGVPGVFAVNNSMGEPTPGHRTEIRARWTKSSLYFLFVCSYENLYLHPNPDTTKDTYKLWEWDVAEVFLGSDLHDIRRYKEFEVSPQAEWVDLDIDLAKPHKEDGWTWNSLFTVAARIDPKRRIWYGAMRIPYASVDSREAAEGNELRANFYRLQGPPPQRKGIAWQPTHTNGYHVPEAFGTLVLSGR